MVIVDNIVGDFGPSEALHFLVAVADEVVSEFGIFDEALDGVCDGVFVADIDQECVLLVICDAFESEDATGDDGCSRCHGFDENEAEALVSGVGGAKDVSVLVVGW